MIANSKVRTRIQFSIPVQVTFDAWNETTIPRETKSNCNPNKTNLELINQEPSNKHVDQKS